MPNVCSICRKPKATKNCDLCGALICGGCTQFLEEGTFSFLKDTPKDITHSWYCSNCFESKVTPAREAYDEVMTRAKNLYVFFKAQKREPPILKRAKKPVKEVDRVDRDETILRLAFAAAEMGYNALIDTDVVAVKVRNEGYQKMSWRGTATPAQVDAERFERYS